MSILEEIERRERMQRGGVVLGAVAVPAERAATAKKVADALGITPDMVLADPSTEQEARTKQIMGVLEKAPATRQFLTNPDHAAIAHDQTEALARIEQKAKRVPAGSMDLTPRGEVFGFDYLKAFAESPAGNLSSGIVERVPQLAAGLGRTLFGLVDRPADLLAAGAEALGIPTIIEFTPKGVKGRMQTPAEKQSLTGGGYAEQAIRAGEGFKTAYKPGTSWEDVKRQPVTKFLPFALEQGIVSAPDMAAAVLALPAYVAARTGEIGGDRATNDGRQEATVEDLFAALPAAAGSAALERLGTRGILGLDDALKGGLKGVPAAVGKASLKEGLTEAGQQVLESLGATVGTKKGVDGAALLDETLAAAAGGAGFGGVMRAGTGTLEAFSGESRKAESAKDDAAKLDDLVQEVSANPLTARDPEAMRAFLEGVTEGEVHIPAKAVMAYLQARRFDDVDAVLDEWGIADQMQEAMAADADIVVDTSVYLSKIAPQHHDAFREDLRIGSGSMSLREAAEFDAGRDDGLQDAAQKVLDQSAAELEAAAPAEQVYQTLYGQALDAGYVPDVARQYAELWAARYAARAARSPELYADALEAFNASQVSVRAAMPEALNTRRTMLDVVINALRVRAKPDAGEALFGPSLLSFVSKQGGIVDTGGELARMDAGTWHIKNKKVGRRKLIRDVKDPTDTVNYGAERMAEKAFDVGYITEPTEEALLAAVQEELAGRLQFPSDAQSRTTQAREDFGQAVEQLDEILGRLGLDVGDPQVTNEQIKAAVEAYAADPQGAMGYEQVPPDAARALAYDVNLPTDPLFAEAVANTPTAEITPDGLKITLVRYQKVEQHGDTSVRTGVFYLPKGSSNERHYRKPGPGQYYGGSDRIEGETLIRAPLFVKGSTGGKAPEAAFIAVKGKAAFEKLVRDVKHVSGGAHVLRKAGLLDEAVSKLLEEYGADSDMAWHLAANSQQGNQLRYALQENIIAHVVREAGFDAIVGYSRGKNGPFIAEVFDVREVMYPTPEGDFEVHGSFLQRPVTSLFQGGVDTATNEQARPAMSDAPVIGASERISTRQPSTMRAQEDPLAEVLDVGLEPMTRNERVLEYNAELIRTYPGFRSSANSPEGVIRDFMNFVEANLLWLFDQVPEETRNRSRLWYDGGNALAVRWGERFGVPPRAVAAVIASLSPQKDWYQNVSLAERILDITSHKGDHVFDEQMAETARRIYDKPAYAPGLDAISGKSLNEVDVRVHRAMWVRIYDETYNPRGFRITTPEGDFIGEATGKVSWGSNVEIAKALAVLADTSRENISGNMGGKHKVRSFYNNLIAPNDGGDVTIDTHAVAAALLRPLSGSSAEVHHNFGSSPAPDQQAPNWRAAKNAADFGIQGVYGIYADAYRSAAAARGVLPREMQSITWEAIRGLFEAKAKRAKDENSLTGQVNAAWRAFEQGRATIDETRRAIEDLAGGIEAPTWEGPGGGVSGDARPTSYDGELAGRSLPGRSPGGLGDRGGNPARTDAEAQGEVGQASYFQSAQGNFTGSTITIDGRTRSVLNSAGSPIAETEAGLRAFWAWFGDSQAVDASGRPMVLYHGAPDARGLASPDGAFKSSDQRYGGDRQGVHWFTPDRGTARSYADPRRAFDYQGAEPAVVAVYLRIENPSRVDGGGKEWREAQAHGKTTDVIEIAQGAGNDGVIIRNVKDDYKNTAKTKTTTTYAVFNNTQIKAAAGNSGAFDPADPRLFFQPADGSGMAPRGRIDLMSDMSRIITLFESRDLSTLLHEGGHLWLEELRQDAAMGSVSAAAELDIINNWFDKNGLVDPVEQHEAWARATEAYLMEGKAPSQALRGAFSKFRSWLKSIYRTVAGLNTPINDDIRGVMDRLLATDAEIEAARQSVSADPMFTTAMEAGMTEAEFTAYNKAVERSKDATHDALLVKVMNAITRERTAEWKAEAEDLRPEAIETVDAAPEMRALNWLRSNRQALSREAVIDVLGDASALALLPKGVPPLISDKGGIHPDSLADVAGYQSGQEMLLGLMSIEAERQAMKAKNDKRSVRTARIDAEVARIQTERHGDPFTDGSIQREAMDAIHHERQGEVLAEELRALGRKVGQNPTPLQMLREWARATVAAKKMRDATRTDRYLRAERKAANAAQQAAAKGDNATALKEKQTQTLNHLLYNESTKAAAMAERAVKLFSRYAKARTLKGMDQDYLEQIHALLEQYDFAPTTLRGADRRASLAAWVQAKRAANEEVVISEALLNRAGKTSYVNMTMEELSGLYDTVRSIAKLGTLKQKLLDGKEQRDFEAVIDEAQAQTQDLPTVRDLSIANPKENWGALADAALIKVETVLDWLDRGDVNGIFNRLLIRPATDAANLEGQLREKISKALGEHREAVPKAQRKAWLKAWTSPLLIEPRTGQPIKLQRGDLIAMALNVGNTSNLDKLARGYGWNPDTILNVLNQNLTKEEWAYVQGVWTTVGSLWPDIVATERKMSGVAPEAVIHQPVVTPFGTLPGGYYPVVYDYERTDKAPEWAAKEAADMFNGVFYSTGTPKGHTQARTGFAAPITLSVSRVLGGHVNKVIKRIAYAEFVMSAKKIIEDSRVRQIIQAKLGPEYYNLLMPWLQRQVVDQVVPSRELEGWEKFIRKARVNFQIVAMGFRVSTGLAQVAGLTSSAAVIGPEWVAKGTAETVRLVATGNLDFVFSRSPEMEQRGRELDRDLRDAMRDFEEGQGLLDPIRRAAFMHIGFMDRYVVALPTWLGAYNKAISQGMSEDDAIAASDKAVRASQGSGRAKDLAAFQAPNTEFMKLFTLFYSYFNVQYQRQRDAGRMAARGDIMPALNMSFWMLIAAPLAGAILTGDLPDFEDDEGWLEWGAWKVFANMWAGVPLVRDVTGYLERKARGKYTEYSPTPLVGVVGSVEDLLGDIIKLVKDGEPGDRWIKHAIQTPGYFVGLPTGQPSSTVQYLFDMIDGDQNPENVGEFLYGLAKGPQKDQE